MSTDSYRWDAEGYAKRSSPQQKWASELISKLSLQGDERVLDIGCGDGKVTIDIAHALPEGSVVGIDKSEAMIDLARTRYPENDFRNVRFRKLDARRLPFRNEFDVVFSNATLHWIQDHRTVLQGISRSLKTDGKILLQMGGEGNGAEIIRAAEEVIQSSKWARYFTDFSFPYAFYAPEEYRRWLEETGLCPVRAELIPKDMTHDDPDALAAWLQTVFLPYTERVPETERQRFIEEVVERYLEQHPVDEKGRTHVRMVRLEVEAEKEDA